MTGAPSGGNRAVRCLGVILGSGLLGTAALVLAAAPAGSEEDLRLTAAELGQEAQSLQAVCGKCHPVELVLDTPMTYDDWHDTVQKMLDQGASATDEELQDIMDYLHRTMTRIDVNAADEDELQIVLNLSPLQARSVLARRARQKFRDLADLQSVPGLDPAALAAKARLLSFQ